MRGPKFYQNWVGDLFDDFVLWCAEEGTQWRVKEKLSERATFIPAMYHDAKTPIAEAQAVYTCEQIRGKALGTVAIVKIRLQVPPEFPVSFNPLSRSAFASKELSLLINQEVASLSHFNKIGCKVTPKILYLKRSLQESEYSPVPGGYIMFILMEKVPGVPLTHFWEYDSAKREKIRAAFRESLTELYRCNGYPLDRHLGNLVYDEEQDKCWFVDYEEIVPHKTKKPLEFSEGEYRRWNLVGMDGDK